MNTSNSSLDPTISLPHAKIQEIRLLTKTTNRTAYGLPKRQKQANGREGLFTTTERFRILLPSVLRSNHVVRLDLELQCLQHMVEQDFAEVASIGEMRSEIDLASQCDMTAEIMPFLETDENR